jgi:RNA polymerase sigma-70 factor (ECF subfamily)
MQHENQIIRKVLSGNVPAYSAIVRSYQQRVYSLALRILRNEEDAEEAASDAFLKAYQSLNTFRMDSKFSTWLFRIAYNSAISRLRKRKTGKKDIEVYSIDAADIDETRLAEINNAMSAMEKSDREKFISSAIERLDPDEAAIVNMYYFDELSVSEICGITELTKSNVKIKLHRSRKKLSDYLSNVLKNELHLL